MQQEPFFFVGDANDDLVRDIHGFDADGDTGPAPVTVWFTTYNAAGAEVNNDTGVPVLGIIEIQILMRAGDDTVDLGAGMPGINLLSSLVITDSCTAIVL